jgi:preprotein translocase subunit SecG
LTIVILVIHLFVAAALVGLVLVQRSEGGALGMGGGSNSLISGRGAADALARLTMVAGAIFFVTSISLTMLAGSARHDRSVIDRIPGGAPISAPAPTTSPPLAAAPIGEDPGTQRVPSAQEAVQRAGPLQNREELAAAAGPLPTPSAAPASTIAPRAAPLPASSPGASQPAAQPARLEAAPRRAPAAASTPPAVSTIVATPSTTPPESVEPAPAAVPAPTLPRPRAGPEE